MALRWQWAIEAAVAPTWVSHTRVSLSLLRTCSKRSISVTLTVYSVTLVSRPVAIILVVHLGRTFVSSSPYMGVLLVGETCVIPSLGKTLIPQRP